MTHPLEIINSFENMVNASSGFSARPLCVELQNRLLVFQCLCHEPRLRKNKRKINLIFFFQGGSLNYTLSVNELLDGQNTHDC